MSNMSSPTFTVEFHTPPRANATGSGIAPGHNIYVNFLPQSVNDDGLRAIFSAHGEVTSAKVMMNFKTGKSKSYGFVSMASEEGCLRAIAALDGAQVENKRLHVSRSERDASEQSVAPQAVPKLYFEGIPSSWTTEDLTSYSCKFGVVVECAIRTDPTLRLHTGCGTVLFESKSAVGRALNDPHAVSIPLLGEFRFRVRKFHERGVSNTPPIGGLDRRSSIVSEGTHRTESEGDEEIDAEGSRRSSRHSSGRDLSATDSSGRRTPSDVVFRWSHNPYVIPTQTPGTPPDRLSPTQDETPTHTPPATQLSVPVIARPQSKAGAWLGSPTSPVPADAAAPRPASRVTGGPAAVDSQL